MANTGQGQVGVRRAVPEEVHAVEAEGVQDPGVTLRAMGVGFCVSVVVSLLTDTARYVLKGSYLAYDQMPMGNLILFLLVMLGSAALARWVSRWFVLSQTEWITVFCVGFAGATLGPTYGVGGHLVGIMAAPYYFATTGNRWAEFLHPRLPGWLIPTNEHQEITWFFEGLPRGASIPWEIWALPLLWWFSFIGAAVLASACVSILIHRQWSENERLAYPMMVPVVDLTTQGGTGRRALPEFMEGRAFWAGFGLMSAVFGWNMVSWFLPTFPAIPTTEGWIFYSRHYPPILVHLSAIVICFSYFAPLDILFSLWFFDLIFILEGGALNRIGIPSTSPHYGAGPYKWQTAGAFIALVLWGLWIARAHLRDAFLKALHPDSPLIDDGRELLSYRGAFVALGVSCLYMGLWLFRTGMEVRAVVLAIPAMFIVNLGVAKMLAHSGLIHIAPPAAARELSVAALGGSAALGISTHVSFGLSAFILDHYRGFALPVMSHVNRLGDFVATNKRRLFWAVCAASLGGMAVSTFYSIWLGYTVGAYNFEPNWLIVNGGRRNIESYVQAAVRNPGSMGATDGWFFLAGAGLMAFLNLMRYRFIRWPFHPIGFALSGASFARRTGVTIFVAWVVKFFMLKLAGPSFYRRSKPFFIGLLVGYVLAVAAGVAADALWFPTQGHVIHKY